MDVSDGRRLNELEDENRKLKKLLAESMLDAATLKEMLGKASDAKIAKAGRELDDEGQWVLAMASASIGRL